MALLETETLTSTARLHAQMERMLAGEAIDYEDLLLEEEMLWDEEDAGAASLDDEEPLEEEEEGDTVVGDGEELLEEEGDTVSGGDEATADVLEAETVYEDGVTDVGN